MARGPLYHRMTVLTFSYLYVIISVLWILALFSDVFLEHISFSVFAYGFLKGIFTFVIGFFGIYALKKKDGGKIVTFGQIVAVIFFTEFLGLIVLVVVLHLRTFFIDYKTGILSTYFNNLIPTHCCESFRYSDWGSLSSIIQSCCKDFSICDSYYYQRCTEKISNSTLYVVIIVAAVDICIMVLKIFTAKFALHLAKEFNEADVNSFAQQPHHFSKGSLPSTTFAAPQIFGAHF